MIRSAPPAEESHAPDIAQDLRGWFYRAVAPDGECAILEVGEAHLANWFTNVVSGNLATTDDASRPSGEFDVVAIHQSLGGCATLRAALSAAHNALRPGGTLAMTGTNRLRAEAPARRSRAHSPRTTGWTLRREAARAGFGDVALYVTHPPARDPIYAIDVHPRSARAFFRAQLAGQAWPVWSAKRIVLAALVATNLLPYLQPEFIVVRRKC